MLIILILLLVYNLVIKKKNLIRINKFFGRDQNLSIRKLIQNINKKRVDKVWIDSNSKNIISIEKKNNQKIYITPSDKMINNKIINRMITNNINFGFYKLISCDIIKIIKKDLSYIYHKIIIPVVYIIFIIGIVNLSLNMFDNYEDFYSLYNRTINKKTLGNNIMLRNTNSSPNNSTTYNPSINTYSSSFANSKSYSNHNILIYPNVSLSQWVGSPEVFEECWEVISWINNHSAYKAMGAELPRGILLEGPPGVGKTLLAKAIATETNSTFLQTSGSEFVEVYVGVGASRVRNLFKLARTYRPSIIFIDEIDTIGKQRNLLGNSGSGGSGGSGGSDERDQTLNQLLKEMDGFEDNSEILVLAATNRKDILDKALLRPGRFDRIIHIGLPDKYSRTQILNFYLDNKKNYTDSKIDVSILVELTDGYSGAELKNLVNEATILAVRRGSEKITMMDLSNALEKSLVGLTKSIDTRDPETIKRIAIHEVGHGFITMYFSQYFDLQKITIKSTYSGAGGYTIFNEKSKYKNDGLYTYDILFKRLIISMGGKAAEFIWYGNDQVSLGATQDLKQSNELARKMVGLFGMGNELETFYNKDLEYNYPVNKYSEKTIELFDMETMKLVTLAYNKAKEILLENKEKCDKLIELLIENKTLTNNEFNQFM